MKLLLLRPVPSDAKNPANEVKNADRTPKPLPKVTNMG